MTERKSKLYRVIEQQGLTEQEAISALTSSRKVKTKQVDINISKDSFKFVYMSDLHIGEKHFLDGLFDYVVEYVEQTQPDFILNPGDHLEGMSGRPGHVYEMTEIGFQQQIEKAVELYTRLSDWDHYGIDGNHDQWYYKKNNGGVIVGNELAARVPNYHNLGQDEGIVDVNGIKIMLFHPNDGTAYAVSYKLQKLIESFTGGEKPHIVLEGHYHKAMSMWCRGVYGIECGTLCGQSQFMRGKKIPAHTGFGEVEVFFNKNGLERVVHEFIPWYQK